MLKRWVLLLLLILLITTTQSAELRLLSNSENVQVGTLFDIVIRVEDVSQLHAYSLSISYQPSTIRYVNVTKELFFPSGTVFFKQIDTVNGIIHIDEAILGMQGIDGSGNIFKIRFEGKQNGNSTIQFQTIDLRDTSNAEIQVSTPEKLIINVGTTALSDELTHTVPTLRLYQNYPNPFNNSTEFCFQTSSQTVMFKAFTLSGAEVFSQRINVNNPERTIFRWNGTQSYGDELPSGVYLIRIETPSDALSTKIILIK
jgi:hypothetical protein